MLCLLYSHVNIESIFSWEGLRESQVLEMSWQWFIGKKIKNRNDTSDYSVEMILLNFLWFEDRDSPGYWDGVAVWISKASKKKSCAMHGYVIWRSCTECHFHSFRPQYFKKQRVSSLDIQEVSTYLCLLKIWRNLLHIKKFFWLCSCVWFFFLYQ